MRLIRENRNFFLVLCVAFIINFYSTVLWSRPPGPLIGGDVYRFTGLAQGAIEGRSLLYNDPFKGEITYYAWLSNALFSFVSHVTGFDVFETFLVLIDFTIIVACLSVYVAARRLFSEKVAIIALLVYLGLQGRFSESNPRDFALVLFPLLAWSLYEYYAKGDRRHLFSSSILFGAMALYSNQFSGIMAMPLFFSVVLMLRNRKPDFRRAFIFLIPAVFFVSWFLLPLYFQYNLKTVEVSTYYSAPVADPLTKAIPAPPSLLEYISGSFFSFSSIGSIVKTIANLYMLYLLLTSRDRRVIYMSSFLLLGILIMFSPSLTQPVFGSYIQHSGDFIPRTFLTAVIVSLLLSRDLKEENMRYLMAFLLLFLLYGRYRATLGNEWHSELQYSPLPEELSSLRQWVLENTPVDAVFAASPEASYLINGITGRHILVTLYSHTNDFVPYLPRAYNNSILFQTPSDAEAYQIAREWDVDYVFLSSTETGLYGPNALKFGNSTLFRPVYGIPGIFYIFEVT